MFTTRPANIDDAAQVLCDFCTGTRGPTLVAVVVGRSFRVSRATRWPICGACRAPTRPVGRRNRWFPRRRGRELGPRRGHICMVAPQAIVIHLLARIISSIAFASAVLAARRRGEARAAVASSPGPLHPLLADECDLAHRFLQFPPTPEGNDSGLPRPVRREGDGSREETAVDSYLLPCHCDYEYEYDEGEKVHGVVVHTHACRAGTGTGRFTAWVAETIVSMPPWPRRPLSPWLNHGQLAPRPLLPNQRCASCPSTKSHEVSRRRPWVGLPWAGLFILVEEDLDKPGSVRKTPADRWSEVIDGVVLVDHAVHQPADERLGIDAAPVFDYLRSGQREEGPMEARGACGL
ncbi:hypothetical protein RJ55_02779 [Drechmeria coniospora]|nr:hypothetical protein RJ55_02779 [Drechmeria coniospora]